MALNGSQIQKIQQALLSAYSEESLDQMVLFELDRRRPEIAGGRNLSEIVLALIDWAERSGRVADLLRGAYNQSRQNPEIQRLFTQMLAERAQELTYLDEVITAFNDWAETYTPLAGVAEVETAPVNGPHLPRLTKMMPAEFEKLVEHGLGAQRQVERVPVDDLREAIREYRRLVLLGEPGSGKTTTLRRLAYEYALAAQSDPQAPLPLLVSLGGYTGSEAALDYLRAGFGRLEPYLPAYLQHKRVILLLDGLNEMPQQGYRERVRRIQGLLETFRDVSVIVTCRALDYVEALQLEKLEVKALDPIRQMVYLQRYLGPEDGERLFWQLAGAEIAELWQTWQRAGGVWEEFWTADKMPEVVYQKTTGLQDGHWIKLREGPLPPLLGLGANPYMLAMLLQVYVHSQGVLPQNRGRLFAAFVDILLSREAAHIDPTQWPGANGICTGLAQLAYAMQNAGERGTSVDAAWAMAQLGAGDYEPGYLLRLAAGATLLELTQGQVRFVHQLIQEYFAALALQGKLETLDLATLWPEGWPEPSGWEETFVLLAGIVPAMTPLVQRLLPVNPPLAARCITESGGIKPEGQTLDQVQTTLVSVATEPAAPVRRRNAAGDALNYLDDQRPGVGLTVDGWPDILWRPVPAGKFIMGNSKETDEMAFDDEEPQHQVTVAAFAISQYPITNVQYEAFVRDGGYSEQWRHVWTKAGWHWKETEASAGPRRYGGVFDLPNHPVVGASWYEAVAFCNWLSEKLGQPITLPTEAQWEKAARGVDGRRYPWGNEPDPNRANYAATGIGATSVVGCFPDGSSPYGVQEMAGNVLEWTSSLFKPYPYSSEDGLENPEADDVRTLRGGSWNYDEYDGRCAFRGGDSPNLRVYFVGFRVVSPGF